MGFTLFRDEASQELRSVCRTCLQVCRSPAMSCAATPAMRAEQTETSPTVVSSGPVSVTKQEEDMMMASTWDDGLQCKFCWRMVV